MRDLISKGLLTAAAATSVLSLGGGYAHAADAQGAAGESPGVLSGNSVSAPVEIPVNVCGNTVDPVGLLNPSFGNHCGSSTSSSHDSVGADRQDNRTLPAPNPAHGPMPGPGPAVDQVPMPAMPAVPEVPSADQMHAFAHHHHATSHDATGSTAQATAQGSPGLLSGNLAQAPLDIPANACGISGDIVGALNPAFGGDCASGPVAWPQPEPAHHTAPPVPEPVRHVTPHHPTTNRSIPPVAPATFHEPALPAAPVAELAHTGADQNLLAAGAMSAGLLLGGAILYRRGTAAARD